MAYADNGHEFIYFSFCSEHRANSRANKEDAEEEYRRKHGHKVKIISTERGIK